MNWSVNCFCLIMIRSSNSWSSLETYHGLSSCAARCPWPSSTASIPQWSWLPSGRIHTRPVLNEVCREGRRPPRRSTASVVALSIPTEWPEGSQRTHPRSWNPCFTHPLVPHLPWINAQNIKSLYSVSYEQYLFQSMVQQDAIWSIYSW